MSIPSSPDCPLCRANGLLKAEVIAESDAAYLMPAHNHPGNYLIVPNAHTESLTELPDDWWKSVKVLLAQVPGAPAHYNMSINLGQPAGQTIRHIHFWIIPRQAGQPSSGKGFVSLIKESNDRDLA